MTSKMIVFLFFVGTLGSCYYDVEEELYPVSNCSTEVVSYKNDVDKILATNCYVCHKDDAIAGAGISLNSYSKIITYVNNGGLLGSIKHQAGYSPMPKSGTKLSSCDIQKIEKWVADGSLDN